MGLKRKGEGSAKSKHSPFMSSQLAASVEAGLGPQRRVQRKKLVFF